MTSPRDAESGELIKLVINTDGHWSGTAAESVWVAAQADGSYELRNTPFYAYGLSWGDIVRARLFDDGAGERLWFDRVVRRGGHRTIRIFFLTNDDSDRARVLSRLKELGVSHEHARGSLYSVDVMPEADYAAVTSKVESWTEERILHWELGSDET